MKIGVVCYPTYGGSGIVATELGMEMAKRGHEIHFISYNQPERLNIFQEGIHYHQVEVESYPLFKYPPYTIALSSQIVEITKQYHLDILHVHYAIPHASSALFAKRILADEGIKLPIVTTLHGTDITLVGQHPSYKSTITFSINHSDYVTAVSESLKKDTQEIFNIQKDIVVIPNFIDTNLYSSVQNTSCNRRNFLKDSEKLLMHVSNFRAVKNVSDVVAIFQLVQAEIPSKLLLVGTGPDHDKVRNKVQQNGLQDKVIFLGKTNQIQALMRLSDLFLLPSSQESFGLAALEAMAGGVPVISTNVGGIPEVNIAGKTGYLAAVHDIEQMAAYAIKILKNETVLSSFKTAARNRALDFHIDKIIPLYEELYQKVIQLK